MMRSRKFFMMSYRFFRKFQFGEEKKRIIGQKFGFTTFLLKIPPDRFIDEQEPRLPNFDAFLSCVLLS